MVVPADVKGGPPTLVFQAPNTTGLGHINRLAAIALALEQIQPSVASAFAIDGWDHGLLDSLGLAWVSLPSAAKMLQRQAWSRWPAASREQLLQKLAEPVLEILKPAAMVFDCLPQGMLLAAARRRRIPFAFVVRKMKSPEVYVSQLRTVLDLAAAIIVPHDQDEFALPRQWEGKTHYVGTIVRQRRGTAESFDASRFPEPRIVITGGGGGYPGTSDFYNLAVEACRQCRQRFPTLSAILVTGPLFQEWSRIRPADTVLLPSCWDMPGLCGQAALVICQAGYNTVAEVVASGRPAISIPGERELDDQADRARLVEFRHARFSVLETPTVDMLAAKISSILQSGAAAPGAVEEEPAGDGARRAARIVASLMRPQGRI